MRKEYGKALQAAFDRQVTDAFPEFIATKVRSKYAFPGERFYCRAAEGGLRLWVALIASQKSEEFTVEVGWSRLGRFPELSGRPASQSPSPDRAEFGLDEYFTRLSSLWSRQDPWWVIEALDLIDPMASIMRATTPIDSASAERAVAPQVTDAIHKLRTHGIPYLNDFQRYLQDHQR